MGRKRKLDDKLDGLLGIQGTLASGSQQQPKSALVALLVTKYLWGELPAILLQEICSAAVQDGLEHAEVQIVARVGTEGLHTGPFQGNQ